MTAEKLLKINQIYQNELPAYLYNFDCYPERHEDPKTFGEFVSHLSWMAEEIPKIVAKGKIEKAMRWLGWMQGAMCAMGIYGLGDLKKHNMPEESSG